MMNVAMVITIESYQLTGTSPIYCHRDYLVCCENIGHVPVDIKVITMATFIHHAHAPVLSPSFLYHSSIPFFYIRRFFINFNCLLTFLVAYCVIYIIVTADHVVYLTIC